MKITIGKYDENARQIAVTFKHDGITHKRAVNACHDAEGAYDKKATAARCKEVAAGVQVKIEAGLFRPEPKAPATPNETAIIDKMVSAQDAQNEENR